MYVDSIIDSMGVNLLELTPGESKGQESPGMVQSIGLQRAWT